MKDWEEGLENEKDMGRESAVYSILGERALQGF